MVEVASHGTWPIRSSEKLPGAMVHSGCSSATIFFGPGPPMLSEQMNRKSVRRRTLSRTIISLEVIATCLNVNSANSLGAVNPRDSDLSIVSDGDHLIFNGFKNFNTGGVVSDLTVLEGVYEGTEHHIFAFAPTQQAGIRFAVSQLHFPKARKLTQVAQLGQHWSSSDGIW